jgi:uncharacterized SAM-binding protein YcdF (DUF218 family)
MWSRADRAEARPALRRPARLGLLLLLAALLAVGGRALWLPLVGGALIVSDPLIDTDAVVPLAGEPARADEAAHLFMEGHARWFVPTDMVVADAAPGYRFVDDVVRQVERGGVPPDRILEAPGVADTTYQEVWNIRRLAVGRGWRSLLVVTSPPHTRRAAVIIHDVFRDTSIRVSVRPVPHHWYTPAAWWRTPAGRRETVLEYLKLALYPFGIR